MRISGSIRRRTCRPITGVINGTVEWLFAFPGRLSVTISGADRLLDMPREELAAQIWRDVAPDRGHCGRPAPVANRAGTAGDLRRHAARECQAAGRGDALANLVLAGDWTATGLPATIEGAIRSGNRAAELIASKT